MADSTRKTEADRCLEMLMKANKGEGNKLNKKRSYMDLSRKRGRPKKKKNTAVTGIVDLTTSFDSIAVDDPVDRALETLNNDKNTEKTKKKVYIKWTSDDKRRILEKYLNFKEQGEKRPTAATVHYFAKHKIYLSGERYPKYYQYLKESNIRLWIKANDRNENKKAGRPSVLKPETVKECEAFVLSQFEKIVVRNSKGIDKFSTRVKSETVNSRTLKPQIQAVIRRMGEGDKLDSKAIQISTAWVNKLCRRIGLSMRSKTQGTIKEPGDWREQMERFKHQLAYKVQTRNLTRDDVYNMDQTGCPLTAHSRITRAFTGSRQVTCRNPPRQKAKNQVTFVPVISASGEKLPLQFIFHGTEFDKRTGKRCTQSIPNYKNNFARLEEEYPGCIYYQTATHWSTAGSNLQLIRDVILPHAEERWAKKRAAGESTSNTLLLLLDNWKVHTTCEFKEAVEQEFKGKVILQFLPPNMTHRLQPLDVGVNSALKAKTESKFNLEEGKKLAELTGGDPENINLYEEHLDADEDRAPKDKREAAIKFGYMAWQDIKSDRVLKAWKESTLSEAWDVEVQRNALKLLEQNELFPIDTTGKPNFNPDVEPSNDPFEVIETDEDDIEVSLYDDEIDENEPSEGGAEYDPSNHSRGRRDGTRSTTK